MAEHEHRSGASLPWANITALVIAVVGGLTLLFDPLVSSRPQKGSRPLETTAEQDVDARLWQDPLRVALEHFEKASSRKEDVVARSGEKLQHLKKVVQEALPPPAGSGKRLLILPVAIPGGPYAENNERRLRARSAVLSGLAASGFTPADGEHIGYFFLPTAEPLPSLLGTSTTPSPGADQIVPFESFIPRYADPSLAQPSNIDRVLIIWLRDDVAGMPWLGRLHSLGATLGWHPGVHIVRVIGPGSSTSFNRILREDAEPGAAEKWKLENVEFFAPMPTASAEVIALQIDGYSPAETLKTGPKLHRTVNTDDDVAAALIEELARRRVDLRDNVRLAEEAKTLTGEEKEKRMRELRHVAVIGEWDTLYGRSLPLTFLAEIFKRGGGKRDLRSFMRSPAGGLSSGSELEWFHSFSYSRGIDGRLPGEQNSDKGKGPQNNEGAAARPREGTEGEDQSDYLRRLAEQLAATHHALKCTGSKGLQAVGVLGSDVYDKLMILRALRKALPGVLFFTSDLDARLALQEEWRATHNLIVVSPFGLTLNERYQRNIAPFRDSYQTAVFASTLMITGVMPTPERAQLLPPRIFEIARNGPWELSEVAREFDQPRRKTTAWWEDRRRLLWTALMVLAVVALLLWIAKTASWIRGRLRTSAAGPPDGAAPEASENAAVNEAPEEEGGEPLEERVVREEREEVVLREATEVRPRGDVREGKVVGDASKEVVIPESRQGGMAGAVFANSGAASVIAVLVGLVCVTAFSFSDSPEGEPLAFIQGISVWPTEMVRVIVIVLCAHFFWKSHVRLRQSEIDIQKAHKLPPLPPALTWREWFKALWRALGNKETKAGGPARERGLALTDECLQESTSGEERHVEAEKLWKRYLEASSWSRRSLRFVPLVFLYLVGGVALFLLLGFPTVPARGEWSFKVDFWLLVLTVIITTTLLFYVVDAIRLNRDLIELFNQGITVWPEPARLSNPRHQILEEAELAEYLDIRLIAARTEVVCPLVNYPFVILVLMVVARNSYFDNWDWPASLIAILALNLTWAVYCSLQLFRAAGRARRTAVERLADHRLQALYRATVATGAEEREKVKTRVKLIEETSAEITALRRGAFAPLSDQPFFRAILFSSGGIGVGTMLQYLPSLF